MGKRPELINDRFTRGSNPLSQQPNFRLSIHCSQRAARWRRWLRLTPGVVLCLIMFIGCWMQPTLIYGQAWEPQASVNVAANGTEQAWGTTDRAVEIHFPSTSEEFRVLCLADRCQTWRQGSFEIYHLLGNVQIQQGTTSYSAGEGILWLDRTNPEDGTNLIVYLEQAVAIEYARQQSNGQWQMAPSTGEAGHVPDRLTDSLWFGRLHTRAMVQFQCPIEEISPDQAPEIFHRGMARRQQDLQTIQPVSYIAPAIPQDAVPAIPQSWQNASVQDTNLQNPNLPGASGQDVSWRGTQTTQETPLSAAPMISPITGDVQNTSQPTQQNPQMGDAVLPISPRPLASSGTGTTDVLILPRSAAVANNVKSFMRAGERVSITTGGVRVNITSQRLETIDPSGQAGTNRLVIQADNVVAWQSAVQQADGTTGSQYEIYLEGNVIFAMGERVIYADRMFYNTNTKQGNDSQCRHADARS